jgi:hypothetical protein
VRRIGRAEGAEQTVPGKEQLLSVLRRISRAACQRSRRAEALRALPAHRFVIHNAGGVVHYLYAEPNLCVCIFVGTQANYQDYRDILSRPLPQADDVSPDYKSQAGALLYGDPYDFHSLNEPDSLAEYFRDYC